MKLWAPLFQLRSAWIIPFFCYQIFDFALNTLVAVSIVVYPNTIQDYLQQLVRRAVLAQITRGVDAELLPHPSPFAARKLPLQGRDRRPQQHLPGPHRSDLHQLYSRL